LHIFSRSNLSKVSIWDAHGKALVAGKRKPMEDLERYLEEIIQPTREYASNFSRPAFLA
jgi:hypothetical protein